MTDFLLEILSEEIPAAMQKKAVEDLQKITLESFSKSGLNLTNEQLKCLISPRRIALIIGNLPQEKIIDAAKKIGPKIDANENAIQGFLRANGLKNVSELKIVKHNDFSCYCYEQPQKSTSTKKIIEDILPVILQKMTGSWPKLMRYETNSFQAKWIRPVRNLLCLFGDEILDLNYFGLKSNNQTFGHFLFSQKPVLIDSVAKYEEILRENFVIVDQNERKKEIIKQIHKIKFLNNFELIDNENSPLFDEVNGLCEWPTALLGEIDEKFMKLPKEILILTLKLNQKYFCLQGDKDKISRNFIFISNAVNAKENEEKIINDNQKVVRARLEDASFFIQEDLKISLEDKVQDLKHIIFHEKLGSVFEKCQRIEDLAEFVAIWINHCDISKIKRSALLCKADLGTKTVAEFPELQGKIGSFYAKKQNEDEDIAKAIYEHYLPIGASSELPQNPLGIALAIADKTDTIVGLFLANQKPTSSKDPFALRRSALGIIRICLQNNIGIPFRVLINKSIKTYKPKIVSNLLQSQNKSELAEEIGKFFFERLKNFLKESYNMRPDIVNAVVDDYIKNFKDHKYGDMANLARRAVFVGKILQNQDGTSLIELYKRSANVLSIEEKRDKISYNGKPNRLILKLEQEKTLYKIIKKISANFAKFVKKGEYEEGFRLLKMLEIPLQNFFECVIVNDKNQKLRQNRLFLLSQIREMFLSVADFSVLEL